MSVSTPGYVSPLLNGVLMITKDEKSVNGERLVKLDFGEYGAVSVPPETAMSFISDQAVRDKIRKECIKCRGIPTAPGLSLGGSGIAAVLSSGG